MADIPNGVPPVTAAPVAPATPTIPAPAAPAPAAPAQDVSDRTTEQFQKLLDSNRQLYEQNEEMRRELRTKLTPPAPAPIPQQQVEDFIETDAETGQRYINEQRLQSTVNELKEAAKRAEQKADNFAKTAQDREIERQNREAFNAFPELNPSAQNFDKDFNLQTRALIMDSWVNPADYGGRPLEFIEAASKVRGWKQVAVANAPTPAPVAPANDNKAQATADLPNAPQRTYVSTEDPELERLKQLTRKGGRDGDEALAKRLLQTEHIVGPGTIVQGGE